MSNIHLHAKYLLLLIFMLRKTCLQGIHHLNTMADPGDARWRMTGISRQKSYTRACFISYKHIKGLQNGNMSCSCPSLKAAVFKLSFVELCGQFCGAQHSVCCVWSFVQRLCEPLSKASWSSLCSFVQLRLKLCGELCKAWLTFLKAVSSVWTKMRKAARKCRYVDRCTQRCTQLTTDQT